MKIQRLSEHVWGIKYFANIQVWVVKGENGLILIDTGIQPMANGILRCIEELSEGPVYMILLTHGHPDHVGGLEKILQKYPVPVYAHEIEIPYMEGTLPLPPSKKPRARVKPSLTKSLPVNNEGVLENIEGLTPYLTPGHTPGHVAFYHEKDQVLIAGDLFMTRSNKLKRPIPFVTSNMREAIESGEIVKSLQPQLLSVTHGKELLHPHEQYDSYRNKWLLH